MAKATLMLLAVTVTVLMLAQPVSAGSLSCVVTDPAGDMSLPTGSFLPAAYQDIIRSEIRKKDGVFTFSMELAAPVPANPTLPPGFKLLVWSWTWTTDTTFITGGFPFPPGILSHGMFYLFVLWDGAGFSAILVDRRPLLTGGDALVTAVPFSVKRGMPQAFIEAALIDDPSTFSGFTDTIDWASALGSVGLFLLDTAPDQILGPATWPC